jgi:hypothetical protein
MLVSVPIAQLTPAETHGEIELEALSRLSQAGFGLAPLRLLRAESEEQFYRLNNLPAQLSALFADLDLENPDEDDLEERAPMAQKLLRSHFLLDEVVDLFYEGLHALPDTLRIRRLSSPEGLPEGHVVRRGRPALLALKETWAEDWSFDALWARAQAEVSIALAARPLLLTAAGLDDAGDDAATEASSLLSRPVRLLRDPQGFTGVRFL